VLRFVPYVGVWLAAAMPIALSFAISDGWSPVLWTAGVFVVLELLLAYVVEPWLYGKSAGLSPIAIIGAVLFWTWLWGPIGLLLATPLTVCVAVIGRHIPEFGYFNMLLGTDPVLTPTECFYQRLVALDHEDAAKMIARHARVHGLARTSDEVIIPALRLAEIDRRKGALEPARERFVYEHIRRIVELLEPPAPANAPGSLCIVGAHDDADQIAALAAAKLFAPSQACVVGAPALAAEVARTANEHRCTTVLISAVPPGAAHYAGYLARRLRRELPNVKIAVGLWAGEDGGGTTRDRLAKLGVDHVLVRIAETPNVLRQLATAANQAQPDRAKRSAPR